MLEEIERETL